MNTPPGSWSNKVLKGNTRHEVDNKYGVNDGQDSVSKVNTIDKTYQKSINANKKTNKIKNKIKNNKTQNNPNSKNKVVGHPVVRLSSSHSIMYSFRKPKRPRILQS